MKIADRRAVPEATKRPGKLAFKDAETASGQLLALDDAEGVVTAIVSVTGTEDEVADIIVPGAYRETLVKRRPKVCWAHSWEHPIGRVLHIEELMPGDDRLPTKTKDGQPWPTEAGALVATMQFNMRTREGKDAFEAVRFYSETGECEYSIGYQVPAGKSTRDNKGVRHIKSLDLYELSVVLFGAHTMTGTLDIKAALAAALERKGRQPQTGTLARARRTAAQTLAEVKAVNDGTREPTDDDKDDTVPDHTDGVMVALYPDPAAADKIASAIAGPDGTVAREDLHVTLAYLGKVTDLTMGSDEIVKIVTDALEGEAGLTGTVGGIGVFPDSGDGAPTWVPVDVPGLTLLRETVADALGDVVATDHGFTPHMTIGYNLGQIDPLPEIPVTFDAVRVVYGSDSREVTLGAPASTDTLPWQGKSLDAMSIADVVALTAEASLRAEGKAGGADRNRGGAEELRKYWTTGPGGVEIAWNTPGDFTRCVALLDEHMPGRAEGYCANRHKEMTGMWPGDRDNTGEGKSVAYDPALEGQPMPETKGGYPRLPGSYEERQDALSCAVNEALRGEELDDDRWEWPGVSIDATYDDRLIVSRYKYDGTDTRETFEMDYRFTDTGVALGEPDPVELRIVAVGVDGEDVDDVALGDLIPFAEDVERITHAFKTLHGGMEVKAGRVLSGSNERQLRQAVENLVNVLAAAGVKITVAETATDEEDDPGVTPGGQGDVRKPDDPAVDRSTTSPSATDKKVLLDLSSETGTVVVTSADVEAQLAALGL